MKQKQLIGLGCDRCPNNMPEEYIKEKKYLFKPYCDMQDDELISTIYKPPCERGDILYVREVARIWLKVTDVRVEQLQDMTLDDFLSEGASPNPEAFNDPENAYGQAKRIFMDIWNSTIKKSDQDLYSWDANPWVWVIEFEKCEKPESEG